MTLTMTTLSWAEGESAVGATGPTSGTCGAESNVGGRGSVKWEVTPNGGKVAVEDETGNFIALPAYTLTISGKGDIMDEPGQSKAGCWAAPDKNKKMYGDQITQVIIEEGVTGIGAVAFNRNLHKSTISIPASVTKIGKRAFGSEMVVTLAEGNTAFKMVDNVLFTSDMKTLVRYFPGEGTADSYTVPAAVETILGGAFQKAKINHIDLGSVKTIGEYAFQEAEIPEIVLPESVTKIETQLVNSAKVQKLVLNMNMAEMPTNWLYGAAVEEVVVGKHITKLDKTFKRSNIKKVTFAADSNVKEFVGDTFYEMGRLESIVIPDSVEKMGGGVFRNCGNLKSVVIGAGIKVIPNSAFNGCTALEEVKFAPGSQLEKIAYPHPFTNCKSLTSIELPDSCTTVEGYGFNNCDNLRTIVGNGLTSFSWNLGKNDGFFKATVKHGEVLNSILHTDKMDAGGIVLAAYNGFKALGWYTQEGVKGDKNSINGTSTTVYAVYKADCSFDTNGGTGDVPAIKSYVAPGLDDGAEIANLSQSEVRIPATPPTRGGYDFMGWNTEADGSGVSYNRGDYLTTTNQPLTKLYAQWGKRVDDTVYTVSCDTSLTYTGTSQTPSVTVKMTKGGVTTPLTAGTFRVEADTNVNADLHTGTVYLVENDVDTGVTIDFNYEIKKASCALTVDRNSVSIKGKGTVTLNVSGGTAVTVADGDLKGSLGENGVYTAVVPDSTKNYTVTFTDAGDLNHEGGTKTVTVAVTARSSANLTLSETVKTVKAGVADSVTYTYNGDGAVTATSSDESVAAVTVDAASKTIRVTPLKAGTADILVKTDSTANYKPTAAVLVLTVTNAATIKSDTETKEIDAGAAKELIVNVPDINGKPAKVVFNQAAADYLRGRGEDLTLKLTVIPVPDSLKNSDQLKNKSCIMVEITLTNDAGANVFASSVAGARADVEFFGGTAMENVTAYFVQSAGLTAQPFTYTAATGMIALHLEHFSKYLVAGDTPSTPAAPSSGGRRHYTGTPGAEITGGADQTKRAGDIIKVTAKSDGAKVSAVYVDGAMVDGKYYIVSGNAVKLQGTYTATLSQGTHTLRVVYTNGAAVTTTFVLKGTTSPHTGDPGVGIYLASVVLSIAGSAYVFRKKKSDD